MDSNKSKRVVVYCRVATQAQLDGDHTLEAQSARLHEQAERLGYEIVGEVSEYEKGTTLDRDGWKAVCRLAAEKKSGLILVTQLDRVTRDMWLLPQALSALAENGVWLQSIAEQEMLLTYPFTSLLMLPPQIQWQMAVYNVWQTYRRNAENSN